MKSFSRNWWGKKFIDALEDFTDSGRLSRGRGYARNGKIIDYKIEPGKVKARVKGSVNPYYGVYKEPLYNVEIAIKPIARQDWTRVISLLSSQAGFISRLLINEMPDNIETVFSKLSLHLLPNQRTDFQTDCSCPDYSNPCKHIAGVYYLIAREFDQNPFLIFELRGLPKAELDKELSGSVLGKLLLEQISEPEVIPEISGSYFTEPLTEKADKLTFREFWQGRRKLPEELEYISETAVPAALIKRQGDYPPFWDQDISFIKVMEEIYAKVKHKRF